MKKILFIAIALCIASAIQAQTLKPLKLNVGKVAHFENAGTVGGDIKLESYSALDDDSIEVEATFVSDVMELKKGTLTHWTISAENLQAAPETMELVCKDCGKHYYHVKFQDCFAQKK